MGIDYDGHYGVGYEVEPTEEIQEEYGNESEFLEYVDWKVGGDYHCFQTGNAYSGEYGGVYVVLRDLFKDGLDLTKAKEDLEQELDRIKVKPVGEFRDVGGIFIC